MTLLVALCLSTRYTQNMSELISVKVSEDVIDLVDRNRMDESRRKFVSDAVRFYCSEFKESSGVEERIVKIENNIDSIKDLLTVLIGLVSDIASGGKVKELKDILTNIEK